MPDGTSSNLSELNGGRRTAPSWKLFLLATVLAVAATWGVHRSGVVPREAAYMAGIFVLAAALWVTEALPLFATSLLVIGLEALLLANPGNWPGLGFENGPGLHYRDVLSSAADPVLVLFFGGLVLAQGARKVGMDHAASALLLRPFGTHPRWVLLGVMLVTLLFGMWMSNTATAAMMLAIVTPMATRLPAVDPFRKALLLAVPMAANFSGMGTPIASPPNAVAIGFLRQAGHAVDFLEWTQIGTPLALLLTLFTWCVLWAKFPPATSALRIVPSADRPDGRGWLVGVVWAVTVLLWMSDRWHGLPSAVVALVPVIVLTATGIFTRKDLAKLDWDVLILIAGGISLGTGMQASGLDRLLVEWLPSGGAALLVSLVLGTWIVGTFMSNTAAANLFLPVGLSAAGVAGQGAGLEPVTVAMSIALAASLSMTLPISTPPNALAYAQGELSARDLISTALLASSVGILALVIAGRWLFF